MNQETKNKIEEVFNALAKISVKGEDVLILADCLRMLQVLYAQPTIEQKEE